MSQQLSEYVAYYLNELHGPNAEDAYDYLRDTDNAAVPQLIEAYYAEKRLSFRIIMIQIIWNHKDTRVVEFLGGAVREQHPEIWKTALDGFWANVSARGVEILNEVKHDLLLGVPQDFPEK